MKQFTKWILLLLCCVLCASCGMFTPNQNPDTPGTIPDAFRRPGGKTAPAARWWKELKRPELNRLVDQALANNLSLAQALARLQQAEAVAMQRGAARIPELTATGSATITDRKEPVSEGADTRSEIYQLGVAASYEVDLWGRVSATRHAARRDVEATTEDLATAELSVAAQVTLGYLELMKARAKLDLLEAQRETNRQIESLIELRFRRSQASALDVLQQRANLAALDALLPSLRARESLLLHELAVLLGQPAGRDLGLKKRTLPTLARLPNPGLPSDLLSRRPDVRAALKRLEAADWAMSAARADRLPALRLTGSAAYSGDEVDALFDNWITQLIGSLAGPLLDGGRRRAEVLRTRAQADERIAAYRSTVLSAMREVEDALMLSERQGELVAALARQAKAADLTYQEALSRYQKGMESYLAALTSLMTLQKTERELVDARAEQAAIHVRLHRALAGSWKEQKEE